MTPQHKPNRTQKTLSGPDYEGWRDLECQSLRASSEVEALLMGSPKSLSLEAQSMILDFVCLSTQEPLFDGCQVDVLQHDVASGDALVKASVWKKGCSHPIEALADSRCLERAVDRTPLQQALLYAKAQAMSEAFLPFADATFMEPELHHTYACEEDSCLREADPFPEYHDMDRVMGWDSQDEWPERPETAEYGTLPPVEPASQEPVSYQHLAFGHPGTFLNQRAMDALGERDTEDVPTFPFSQWGKGVVPPSPATLASLEGGITSEEVFVSLPAVVSDPNLLEASAPCVPPTWEQPPTFQPWEEGMEDRDNTFLPEPHPLECPSSPGARSSIPNPAVTFHRSKGRSRTTNDSDGTFVHDDETKKT